MKRLFLLFFVSVYAHSSELCRPASSVWIGNLEKLKQQHANKCDLKVRDENIYTLYDIAGLKGQREIQQWLVANNLAKDNEYSRGLIKFVQSALNYLGYNAGVVDGISGSDTEKAIKSYQKNNKFVAHGRLNFAFLNSLYIDVTKKMQKQLGAIYKDIGKADGYIGANTRKAMILFRQKYKLGHTSYGQLDEQLISKLHRLENDKNNKNKIVKNATKESASKAKNNKSTPKKVANNKNNQKNKTAPSSIAKTSKNTKNKNTAKTQVKESSVVKKIPSSQARNITPEQILAEQQAAQRADNNRKKQSKSGGGFNKVSGRLNYNAGRCTIGGQLIDSGWCSSYKPGSLCSVLISKDGSVFSMTCGKKK